MAPPKATDAAIRRAIAAWKDAGLPIGRMEVTPQGHIIIAVPDVDKETPAPQDRPRQWNKIG